MSGNFLNPVRVQSLARNELEIGSKRSGEAKDAEELFAQDAGDVSHGKEGHDPGYQVPDNQLAHTSGARPILDFAETFRLSLRALTMKIALIGGAGVRTPLLVHGLSKSDLPIGELTLYDTDQPRLASIGTLARRLAGNIPVRTCSTVAECVEGADFVFTSIRVGGIESRARNEAAVLKHGIVGQETVGPGGFAMAMRTIVPMIRHAREIVARAPHAWIINFTNPVGIITQAVRNETGARVIGICDTPTELFHDTALVLDLPPDRCHFDYFGLNHLGWLREVFCGGEGQLHHLWSDPEKLARVYRHPLFEPDFLRNLKMLPTEYLYYYYHSDKAAANLRRAGTTRGAVIEKLNARLFAELARAETDSVQVYETYLAARNAGYMQIESGARAAPATSPWASLTGYDKIALSVVRAIHFNADSVIPLDVLNNGNLSCLTPEDVVEVPCIVNSNGALPICVGLVPDSVRDLIVRVKEYERLTIQAAITGDRSLACKALAGNPLVPDTATANSLLLELGLP